MKTLGGSKQWIMAWLQARDNRRKIRTRKQPFVVSSAVSQQSSAQRRYEQNNSFGLVVHTQTSAGRQHESSKDLERGTKEHRRRAEIGMNRCLTRLTGLIRTKYVQEESEKEEHKLSKRSSRRRILSNVGRGLLLKAFWWYTCFDHLPGLQPGLRQWAGSSMDVVVAVPRILLVHLDGPALGSGGNRVARKRSQMVLVSLIEETSDLLASFSVTLLGCAPLRTLSSLVTGGASRLARGRSRRPTL